MKKMLIAVLCAALFSTVAVAEIDLSGMTFDELVELQKAVNLAIAESDGWQEVSVPLGVWAVGDDIPAGRWVMGTDVEWSFVEVYGGRNGDGTFDGQDYVTGAVVNKGETLVQDLYEGQYVQISVNPIKFSPYTGSSLGFK